MVNRILLVNFGGIGDEILFLPVIKSIKERFPNAALTLCLEPRSKRIKDLASEIDDVLLVDIKSKNKYFELIKFVFKAFFGKYDVIISSGANKFIPILLFLTGIKTRIGYNCGGITSKFLTKAIELNKRQFAGVMYHDLVRDYTGCSYNNPQITVEASELTKNMVVVHPGVSKMSIKKNIIKSYSYDKWAELVKMLLNKGETVALVGGPDDDECISAILDDLKDFGCSNFYNFYGKTKNLKELASLFAGAKAVVCCDSAPMHLAIAVNAKTIAFFGPTDEKKLVPIKDNVTVIKVNCDCRPCLWDKRAESCDEKYCLNFSNEDVLNSL
ncbi:MAG: glycosyltransferase family 9 protein [Candidatus Gastranaerophilaceae bacterium]